MAQASPAVTRSTRAISSASWSRGVPVGEAESDHLACGDDDGDPCRAPFLAPPVPLGDRRSSLSGDPTAGRWRLRFPRLARTRTDRAPNGRLTAGAAPGRATVQWRMAAADALRRIERSPPPSPPHTDRRVPAQSGRTPVRRDHQRADPTREPPKHPGTGAGRRRLPGRVYNGDPDPFIRTKSAGDIPASLQGCRTGMIEAGY